MKKNVLVLSFISLLIIGSASTGLINNFAEANAEEDEEFVLPTGSHTINVLNVQDYIDISVIDDFKAAMNEKYGVNDIDVIYSCTDTPETMFNEVKLTPGGYDLICPSDYMIQKLIVNDMITKLDFTLLPDYEEYVSRYIRENYLDPIEAVNSFTGKTEKVGDYAVGYMWGTLGMVFDPTYNKRDADTFISDMQSWDIMWNSDYHGIGTIKDSVRDTYAIGLLHAYDQDYDEGEGLQDGFRTLYAKYLNEELSPIEYNARFSELFNRCDNAAINNVKNSLNSLFGNVFGLEVDQGKQDIVLGKIGINFAWSGDAVYSLDLAEESKNPKELCYSIPETGSNVWFDAWVMPKYDSRDESKTLLAHEFLNYLSNPEIAAKNMNETGYTSFMAGEAIRDLVRDWYDFRSDLIYYFDEEREYEDPDEAYKSLFYYDPEDIDHEEPIEVWYEDCSFLEDQDETYNDVELYYYDGPELEEEDEIDPQYLIDLNEKYNERLLIPDDIETVDLSYFFDGTLEEDDVFGGVFYSDCYLPFVNEDGSQNICVGRQFFTQYPDLNTLTRCAVMRDFGPQNDAVMSMWENFRSTSLPLWAIILFVVELAIIACAVIIYFYAKYKRKTFRKKRNQN